jgi:hypothetical protein
MRDRDAQARAEILARLAESRAELRQVLDPPRTEPDGSPLPAGRSQAFPRSRIMQALLSGRGLGTLGAAAAGLLIVRPALALRLLRMVPAGAVARMLLIRAVSAMRTRRD